MNSKVLLKNFIKETVEDLFRKQFSKQGRIGKVAFEKEIITRLTKEKIVQKINSGSDMSSQDQYLGLILDAVSDVKNFIEEIFNSIVGDNIPTFELEAENKAFHHLYDTFVELLNEATNGVSEEDFDSVMNDTMQKIRGDLDLTYNQIKIALSSIPYNIFLMAELPA